MKRRQGLDADKGTPVELRRYVAAEWGDDEQAPVRWYAARDRWAAEHGEPPESGDGTDWPDVPFDPRSV
jgi:hypothetical protein